MKEISVINNKALSAELTFLRERLGDHLCNWYCTVTPKDKKKHEGDKGLVMSVLPHYAGKIVERLSRYHIIPRYYVWWSRMWVTDLLFYKKVANDESKVLYTYPMCKRSIKAAKKKGKTVVVLLANSESKREYQRVVEDYNTYHIKHRYIYGDKKYEYGLSDISSYFDRFINITEVSRKTFSEAGYDMSKSKLVLDNGTNFMHKSVDFCNGKKRAFISTAFHSFVKGTHRLLLAWKKADIKDVPLLLVGKMCEDMTEFIEKNGPFDNVVFVGHCANLKEWYEQWDAVGVIMSLSEGSGRVTPEMMSFGFPIISSEDATCDLVVDGYNGSVVDVYDENALVEKLRYYANDWEKVHELRPNVLASLGERTINDYASEIADYLVQVASE